MNVINHTMLPRRLGDGCCTQTVADAALCRAPFAVEVLSIEAGAAGTHATCDEARVVLALSGSGKLVVDSGPQRFQAPCTLLVPAGSRFQIVNNAATPMQLVTVYVPKAAHEAMQP